MTDGVMKEEVMGEAKVEETAKIVNKRKKLYCEECCTHFKMNDAGEWVKYKGQGQEGMAEEVAGSFLMCTCGRPLAVKVKHQTVIGEFLALR